MGRTRPSMTFHQTRRRPAPALAVVYQPKVARTPDGARYVGFEALARVNGVAPDPNDPHTSSAALAIAVTAAVRDDVTRAYGTADGAPVLVNVNVEPVTFDTDPGLVAVLVALAAEEPRLRLGIEITERGDATPAAIQAVHQLRCAGIHVALDDLDHTVGSLARARQFGPVNELKIDRSLSIAAAADEPDPETVAQFCTILAYARTIGATVTCEGIETEGHARSLSRLGARVFQGFRYGRPAPLPVFAALIRNHYLTTVPADLAA